MDSAIIFRDLFYKKQSEYMKIIINRTRITLSHFKFKHQYNKMNKQKSKSKNKTKRIKQKARMVSFYDKEATIRTQENQLQSVLESWAVQSGLRYETLKDLIGLNFN